MPFKSKQQMKACFATDGFHGKVDCHEWAHKTPDTKKLPEHAMKNIGKEGSKKKPYYRKHA